MKKYIFYTLLAFMSATTMSFAQNADLTTATTNNTAPSTVQPKVEPPVPNKTIPTPVTTGNKTVQDIISFLPVGFFLFILLAVFIKLRKDGVKLRDILIDKETVQEKRKTDAAIAESHAKVATAAANAISANPNTSLAPETFTPPAPTSQTTVNPEQSTSRLIVFICGITSIGLACCITSFYFYKSFTGTNPVDLGSLSTVLYGLGLGVLPYGFNKISAALK